MCKNRGHQWYAVLFAWRFLDTVLWVAMIRWFIFCAIIIMVFLASSTAMDGTHWLATASIALLQWLVLTPLAFSAILALSYELFTRMTEDYEEIVQGFLGVGGGNASRETTAEVEPEPVPANENRSDSRSTLRLISEVLPECEAAQKNLMQIERVDDEEIHWCTMLADCENPSCDVVHSASFTRTLYLL